MNLKTVIPLVVAVALAGIAAKLGKDMISKGRSGGPGMKMTKVVVAKDDLPPGATIKDADIILRDMPTDGLSQNTFNNVADVSGRMVMSQVVKGQIVLEGFLAPKGVTGAQAMVPQGMRAVSLEVNEFSGVAGLLSPGSHVDLVQTIQTKDDKAGPMAKTIVENLRVIAVGRRLGNTPANPNDADAQPARSVTVLATAAQAEAIDLASHVGSPRLVLRNTLDGNITAGKGITVAELRGAEDQATPKITGLLAQFLSTPATTRPVEPKVVEVKPALPNFREVEVIRAGTSTNVRMKLQNNNNESISGTADKLLAEPQD